MFVRNGQALGSVLHSAVPGADAEPEEKVEPQPPPEPVPEPAPVEVPIPEPEPDPAEVESVDVQPPKQYDAKPEWVEFAVSNGLDREEAESLTKAELIELYGG